MDIKQNEVLGGTKFHSITITILKKKKKNHQTKFSKTYIFSYLQKKGILIGR